MFDKRVARLEGVDKTLHWVARDRDCFDFVVHDWNSYSYDILRTIPKKGFVLQAGGNCGLYPLMYSQHFERVFTFEPDPVNFYCLSANCPTSKIIKFNTALGERGEFLKMGIVDTQNVGMNRIGAGDVVIYSVAVDSLNLHHLDLLHLDVEGFEYQAILGAKQTIDKCRPVVVLEMTALEPEIYKIMNGHNYIQHMEFGTPKNVMFLPKERFK